MNSTFEAQYNAVVKQNRELQKQCAELRKIIGSVKEFCENQTDDCGKCPYTEDNVCNTYDADFCRGKTSATQDILKIIKD